MIESLQPYQGRDVAAIRGHLLWRLNLMCNIDKHRRIPVHGNVTTRRFPDLPESSTPLVEFAEDNKVVSVPLHLKNQMRLGPDVSINVVFGDLTEGISCDFAGVEEIYNLVANSIIPRFSRFFQ
jgi:hypothetical protein